MEQSLVGTESLAITGVPHIEFHVSDLEASMEWVFSIDLHDPDGHEIELHLQAVTAVYR